jgi:hypothetical protein
MSEKQGVNEVLIEPLKQFARDSIHLVKKCTKPDRKEFTMIARAVGTGCKWLLACHCFAVDSQWTISMLYRSFYHGLHWL